MNDAHVSSSETVVSTATPRHRIEEEETSGGRRRKYRKKTSHSIHAHIVHETIAFFPYLFLLPRLRSTRSINSPWWSTRSRERRRCSCRSRGCRPPSLRSYFLSLDERHFFIVLRSSLSNRTAPSSTTNCNSTRWRLAKYWRSACFATFTTTAPRHGEPRNSTLPTSVGIPENAHPTSNVYGSGNLPHFQLQIRMYI